MKTKSITRYKCDKCERIEDVEYGNIPKVQWREVVLDGQTKRNKKEFQFCPKCVSEVFGKEYADTGDILRNERYLKTPGDIETHVEELAARTNAGMIARYFS